MLDVLPDLSDALATPSDEEPAEIFRALDVTVTYDKTSQVIDLAATINPELMGELASNDCDRPEDGRRITT